MAVVSMLHAVAGEGCGVVYRVQAVCTGTADISAAKHSTRTRKKHIGTCSRRACVLQADGHGTSRWEGGESREVGRREEPERDDVCSSC